MLNVLKNMAALGVVLMLPALPGGAVQATEIASGQSPAPKVIINSNEYKNECGVVFDKSGDLIPSPTGNIGFIHMPGAQGGHCVDAFNYYGVLAGTNKSAIGEPTLPKQRFGLFVTFGRVTQNWFCLAGECAPNNDATADATAVVGFSFQDETNHYYMSTSFGGTGNDGLTELQALEQTLFSLTTISSLDSFEIYMRNLASSSSKWTVTSRAYSAGNTEKLFNIYEGYVGQPGRFYTLAGNGSTFLWSYPKTDPASAVSQTCLYDISVDLLDVRGMVPEGIANGYTGIIGTNPGGPNTSAEIAQAGLVVQDWAVSLWCLPSLSQADARSGILPDQSVPPSYSFSGKPDPQSPSAPNEFSDTPGMMWLDTGGQMDVMYIGESDKPPTSEPNLSCINAPSPKPPYPAYVGNWIPLQITSGPYQGFSMAFSVLWDQAIERPDPDGPNAQSSDNFTWSRVGFSHGYSGILEGDITSAYPLAQAMLPGLPLIPKTQPKNTNWQNPFEVLIKGYVDTRKYTSSAFPWAQEIDITLRAGTRLRMAMASYANERCKFLNPSCQSILDDGMTDLTFSLKALSPVSQVTIVSPKENVAPFFEGAATFTISGGEATQPSEGAGVGWIEHMGGPNFCTNPSDSVIPAPS